MTDGYPTDIGALATELRAIRHLLDERDRLYQQQIAASKEAVQLAMSAAEKAVSKAEAASEKRFESVNEFRAQMNDMQATFAKSETVDIRMASVEKKLEDLSQNVTSFHSTYGGRAKGISDFWGWIVAAVTAAGAYIHWALGVK